MTKKIPLQWKDGRVIPVMNTELADLPGEEWKNMFVPGFDTVYKVSSHGRFKSLGRTTDTKNGKRLRVDEKIIKLNIRQFKTAIIISVALYHEEFKTKHSFSVGRIVYYLFVRSFNWESKSVAVSRKDGDTLNCFYKNLALEPAGRVLQQPINQYDVNGRFLKRYKSIQEAAAATSATVSQIRDALLWKGLQGKKYYWRRDPQVEQLDLTALNAYKEKVRVAKFRPVRQFSLEGEPLLVFDSLLDAAAAVGIDYTSGIIKACGNPKLSAHGYRWKYLDIPDAPSGDTAKTIGKNGIRIYNAPVHRYNINGVYKGTYPSASAAAKALSLDSGRISAAIKRKNHTVDDCYWRQGTADTFIDISTFGLQRERKFRAEKRKVQKLTLSGKLIETYDSITIAANAHSVRNSLIAKACNNPTTQCLGFRWRFAED